MFIRATYDRKNKAVHYVDHNGEETLYIGGSFAWRTNNPGNLTKPGSYVMKDAIGYAQRTSNKKDLFAIFPDRATGERYHQALLKNVYGNKSIKGMIAAYAPPSENDTQKYIEFVQKKAGVSSDDLVGSLSAEKFDAVSAAMAQMEGNVAGVIKKLGRPVQVQLLDMLEQPLGGFPVQIKSADQNFQVATSSGGELPLIYSDLLGKQITLYANLSEGELEKIGEFSPAGKPKTYVFSAPYYGFTTRARVHQGDNSSRRHVHVVESGETLSGIARKYQVSVDALVAENKLTNRNQIFVDQHLRLPSTSNTSEDTNAAPSAASEAIHLPPRNPEDESGNVTSVATGSAAPNLATQTPLPIPENSASAAGNGPTVAGSNSVSTSAMQLAHPEPVNPINLAGTPVITSITQQNNNTNHPVTLVSSLPLHFVQLPSTGMGYYLIGPPEKHWGTQTLVTFVIDLAQEWVHFHPGGPRLGINDMSFEDGHHMAPHQSHRNGRNVDIRLLSLSGAEVGGINIYSQNYNRHLNVELFMLMASKSVVRKILFNDETIHHPKRIHWQGHDNHMHVEVR